MDQIEPSSFDVAFVSSGLPEALLASALARAGKSVLLIDASEVYGASWASHSGNTFPPLQHQRQQQDAAGSVQLGEDVGTLVRVPLPPPLPALQPSAVHIAEGVDLCHKHYIYDACPKALYQSEPLVDLLVASRAHASLEFKLLEGSYLYRGGSLLPVPAGKSDVFKDKSLGLADKRSLMRFLNAVVEAEAGEGRLKDAFDDRPLAQLLQAEGLSQSLQEVVLYGIAMCSSPQAPPPGEAAAAASATAAAPSGSGDGSGQPSSSGSSSGAASSCMSAATGRAALRLFSESMGRFGGRGAFMAPAFGSGGLTEAFVRNAAVHGAVTVLRQHVDSLLLQPGEGQEGEAQEQGRRPGCSCVGLVTGAGQVVRCETLVGAASALAACFDLQGSDINVASSPALAAGAAMDDAAGVVTAGAGAARRPQPHQPAASAARALVVLDGPLVPGVPSLLLALPPGSLGPQQSALIRGVQLGPGMCVAPPGQLLLYLSAELPVPGEAAAPAGDGAASTAEAASAEAVLAPVIAALAQVGRLTCTPAPASDGAAASTASSSGDGSLETAGGAGSAAAADGRPHALAAVYYSHHAHPSCDPTPRQHQPQQQLPGNVVVCPDADSALIGYLAAAADAEQLYRIHFPGLPWLGEATGPASGEGAGAAAASQVLEEDELDAMDELLSALQGLRALGSGPAAGGEAAAGRETAEGGEAATGAGGEMAAAGAAGRNAG